jgi:hypothetical protein
MIGELGAGRKKEVAGDLGFTNGGKFPTLAIIPPSAHISYLIDWRSAGEKGKDRQRDELGLWPTMLINEGQGTPKKTAE